MDVVVAGVVVAGLAGGFPPSPPKLKRPPPVAGAVVAGVAGVVVEALDVAPPNKVEVCPVVLLGAPNRLDAAVVVGVAEAEVSGVFVAGVLDGKAKVGLGGWLPVVACVIGVLVAGVELRFPNNVEPPLDAACPPKSPPAGAAAAAVPGLLPNSPVVDAAEVVDWEPKSPVVAGADEVAAWPPNNPLLGTEVVAGFAPSIPPAAGVACDPKSPLPVVGADENMLGFD